MQQGVQINGVKSWGDIEEDEGTYKLAMNMQVTVEKEQHHHGKSLPITCPETCNGACPSSQEDETNLDQVRVSSELGNYGIHSPKHFNSNNENLAALLQTTLASNEIQRDAYTEQPKQGRAAVWLQKKETPEQKGNGKEQSHIEKQTGMAEEMERTEAELVHKTREDIGTAGSRSMVPHGQPVRDGGTQDEGWETPKRKHTCRARVDKQSGSDNLENNVWARHGKDLQNNSPTNDLRQNINKCPKEVELGRGHGPPI
ncbi:hypothetical protein FRX31_017517 [Thalictrum thalictroides]|uniref:Uncharacterized protein n=1 Tax=Thalictrum thalictroides TaxID=46969 RepID=A0A7J6W7K6_THATH|nr:hypothetical protein FRX31_017517 [Thalictrum thalictroides]